MNDSDKALAVADTIIADHGDAPTGDRLRYLLAFVYLMGQRDGITETASQANAAFARLAADLTAVVSS